MSHANNQSQEIYFLFYPVGWLAAKSKLGKTKVAFDNLECSKVRGTCVLRWSSTQAVEIGIFDGLNKPLQDIS